MIPISEQMFALKSTAGYKKMIELIEIEFGRHTNHVRKAAKDGKPIDGAYSCGWADALEWVGKLPELISKQATAQEEKKNA